MVASDPYCSIQLLCCKEPICILAILLGVSVGVLWYRSARVGGPVIILLPGLGVRSGTRDAA